MRGTSFRYRAVHVPVHVRDVISVVPRHPAIGAFHHLESMELQLVQIIERIDVVQLAGMNQAHIDIADAGTVASLVEERILAIMESFP